MRNNLEIYKNIEKKVMAIGVYTLKPGLYDKYFYIKI